MKYAVCVAFYAGLCAGVLLVLALFYANGALLAEGGPR